jgi:hypothetical protein
MKAIQCEIHEPYMDAIRISYHQSIRKALKYCKRNGLSRQTIYVKDGSVLKAVFGNGMICQM